MYFSISSVLEIASLSREAALTSKDQIWAAISFILCESQPKAAQPSDKSPSPCKVSSAPIANLVQCMINGGYPRGGWG
jgi:hypothetical protein